MPVVLNTCCLRSDDLLTFACVPAEEMFLLWLHVSLPFGGSQNHCVRYTRALHFAQCFSSGMSRMSCATGSAPERSRHSQGVSTGCPGEPLRRDSGAPKFLDSPRSSCLRRLNLPRADPLRRNSFFFFERKKQTAASCHHRIQRTSGRSTIPLDRIYLTGVVVHYVLEMPRIRAKVFGVASFVNSALQHSIFLASSTMHFVRIPTNYFEKVSFRDSPRSKHENTVGLTLMHVCVNDVRGVADH